MPRNIPQRTLRRERPGRRREEASPPRSFYAAHALAYFGQSVAANRGWIVVGAPGDGESSDYAGRAFLFETTAETYPLFALNKELVPNAPLPPKALFGLGVGIDGNNRDIVVTRLPTAHTIDIQGPGGAHVFTLGLNGWKERLVLAPTTYPSSFGVSQALGSVSAFIGDYGTSTQPGAVYVYDLTLPPSLPVFLEAPADAAPGQRANWWTTKAHRIPTSCR